MISDFILGLFAFYFFIQNRNISKNWSMFFLFMAVAAFIGSAFHGNPDIGQQFRFLSWSVLSASLIFAQLATYERLKSFSLNMLFVVKSVLFLSFAIHYSEFMYMVTDIAISLLGFVVIGDLWVFKSPSKKITYGILISISSALIVTLKLDIHSEYLTANDLGHYISIISLMYISKGVGETVLEVKELA